MPDVEAIKNAVPQAAIEVTTATVLAMTEASKGSRILPQV